MNDINTQAERERKGKGEEGAFSLPSATISDTDLARDHFRSVLASKDASKADKANAASELARIEHRQGKGDVQDVSRMPRALLVAEIERMRAVLSGPAIAQGQKA
jgi:hypothetical protein